MSNRPQVSELWKAKGCSDMRHREEMGEVLEVPNSWLPESYHTASGSRTLASVEREFDKRQSEKAESIHAEKKASKAELIDLYRSQVEQGKELLAA